jgi:glycerol-3-phosphate acyltransferase PlsY
VDAHQLIEPLLSLLLGYALGSIPFGLILTRLAGTEDLRSIGSRSIGATNVLRTGHKGLAALTLVLDAAKGTVAILLAARLLPGNEAAAAAGALLGHLYPVWLRFEGGKGIATLFGILVGFCAAGLVSWGVAIAYAAVWLTLLALGRFSSVAGMAAAVSAPIGAALFGRFDLALLFLAFALLLIWKHRANIERLLAGTEPRVGRQRT